MNTARERVWITGAGGLIGNELVQSAPAFGPSFQVRGVSRADVDLLDFAAVEKLFRIERPDRVIHCAAISSSVDSQGAPELAYRVNVEATARLLELAGEIPFVFFSTDLVFDGARGNYVETDAPNPLSKYAETKVAAEQVVRHSPRHCIIRISLTGGVSPKGNRGFNEEIKNAWREGRTMKLFVDEFRSPSAAPIVARAVWELMGQGAVGTFHVCGSERISRYEIGRHLAAKHSELHPKILAASRKDFPGPPRPADTSMNCGKAQELLSFPLPRFSEWLKEDHSGF